MRVTATVFVGLLLFSGCDGDDGPGPRIDVLAPSAVSPGQGLDVLGVRFCAGTTDAGPCAPAGSSFVTIGAAEGISMEKAEHWAGTRIRVTVPTTLTAGATSVVVTVAGRASNSASLDIVVDGQK
ncbi:MAG: hypothetical protein HY698_08300 [Deltaproteobacteria bacterium]|nr:hypothetical protein [Deltaproteobacteria bacterium]